MTVPAGESGAAVSMGNTGAVVGAATLLLGTLAGVKRPGIAVTTNLGGKPLTVLDMGANIAPKAEHLVQYGVMGSVYARTPGPARARVALLNIGEERARAPTCKGGLQAAAGAPIESSATSRATTSCATRPRVLVTDGFAATWCSS
jgi:glycerol-3-phosphate acyltransferase PlsX